MYGYLIKTVRQFFEEKAIKNQRNTGALKFFYVLVHGTAKWDKLYEYIYPLRRYTLIINWIPEFGPSRYGYHFSGFQIEYIGSILSFIE